MGGGSGGSGSGGRSGGGGGGGSTNGDAGQPGEVYRAAQLEKDLQSGKISLEAAQTKEREVYRAGMDAFFKEKDYAKADALQKQYEAMHEVTQKIKLEREAAKININWNKVTTKQGSSVRDDTNSGGRVSRDKDFLDMMKRYRSP